MRRSPALATSLLLLAACTSGGEFTTTSSVHTDTTAITTPPVVAATTEAPFEPSVLAATRKQIRIVPDDTTLTAGLEFSIAGAFDDYAGGVVWLQLTTDGAALQRLEAGRELPTTLWNAHGVAPDTFALLDVVAPPSSPPLALLLGGDKLLMIPTTGGDAEVLLIEDLEASGSGGHLHTASLGGNRLLVAWSDVPPGADGQLEDACITVDLFGLDGTPTVVGLFTTCGETQPALSDEGDVVVSLDDGPATALIIRSSSDGLERGRWQATVTGSFHASNGRIAYPDGRGVGVITYDGSWSGHQDVAAAALRSVSLTRAPLDLSELAELGGTAMPTNCSSRGVSIGEQSGLTAEAAQTRALIGEAASTCNFLQLDLFLVDPVADPTADWWPQEGAGVPVLLHLTTLLQTPYGVSEDADGRLVYVWPQVAVGDDTPEAWEALEAIYNIEEIERWRSGTEPYDGMVIRITEDGTWIQASSDF